MRVGFRQYCCGILACVLVFGVLAGTSWAQAKPGSGAALFKTNCVLCHGNDGHAQTPLGKQLGAHDLSSAEVQKKTDAQLKTIITQGQKSMPPFGSQLSPVEIGRVLAYVRELGGKKK